MGLKIVIDSAHGAAYQVAPSVFHELGAEVVSLGASPDGMNINKGVGATASRRICRRWCSSTRPTLASRSTATPTAC